MRYHFPCVIAPLGDAVCVSITLPATLPPDVLEWMVPPNRLCFSRWSGPPTARSAAIPRVVGGHTHSASCKHRKAPEGLVLSAAAAGSVPALAAALSSGGSTEETNKVPCLSVRLPPGACSHFSCNSQKGMSAVNVAAGEGHVEAVLVPSQRWREYGQRAARCIVSATVTLRPTWSSD